MELRKGILSTYRVNVYPYNLSAHMYGNKHGRQISRRQSGEASKGNTGVTR